LIVADASAVLDLLLRGPGVALIEERLLGDGETIHAPHLIDLEIAQVLRRFAAAGELTNQRGREALVDFGGLPLTRYPHDVLLERIWALRGHLTAYDAAYIALAEALDAPLVTRDRRLARSSGHRATVELL
jgi:predicted nucleic acid-binding protein